MEEGGFIARAIMAFKKGSNGSNDLEYLMNWSFENRKVFFGGLEFEISYETRDLNIFISPKDLSEWNLFKTYFEVMKNPDFFHEHGFSQGFLKEKYFFLKDRKYLLDEDSRKCNIFSRPITNNRKKLVESIYYSVVVPFIRYKSFFDRDFSGAI